jgi:hypothetical protein
MTEFSPGAWVPPPGVLPGWDWLPPGHGLAAHLDRVPWWVRAWYQARTHHGALKVLPSWEPPPDPTGDREPRRPVPPTGSGATDVSGR